LDPQVKTLPMLVTTAVCSDPADMMDTTSLDALADSAV
jgi:hypothetical protein